MIYILLTYILCWEARLIHSCKPFWISWAAGISECTIPLPAVIHCKSPASIVPLCPSKSSCVIAPLISQNNYTKVIHIPLYNWLYNNKKTETFLIFVTCNIYVTVSKPLCGWSGNPAGAATETIFHILKKTKKKTFSFCTIKKQRFSYLRIHPREEKDQSTWAQI